MTLDVDLVRELVVLGLLEPVLGRETSWRGEKGREARARGRMTFDVHEEDWAHAREKEGGEYRRGE